MSECSQNLASKSPELLHWTDISKKFRICPLYQPKCQFCPTGNSSVYGMPTMRTPEQWDLRDTSSEHGVRGPDYQPAMLLHQYRRPRRRLSRSGSPPSLSDISGMYYRSFHRPQNGWRSCQRSLTSRRRCSDVDRPRRQT